MTFLDRAGRLLLAEKKGGGRSLVPAQVMGEATFHVQAEFEPAAGEALYGLGAHQNGLMNYAGRDVDMYQLNTVDVVPFLVSSRGYGILWDNTSHTRFGDLREPVHVPAAALFDAEGRPGGLTGTYRQGDCETGSVVARASTRRSRSALPRTGPRSRRSTGAPGREPADPPEARGRRGLRHVGGRDRERRGRRLRPPDVREQRPPALARRPARGRQLAPGLAAVVGRAARCVAAAQRAPHAPARVAPRRGRGHAAPQVEDAAAAAAYTSLWSEVGDGIDYYFVYGPELDDVVAGYRELTGRAPLMPRWALGLWQSRERYQTAAGEPRRRWPSSARAGSRSTRSCRTGSTGAPTSGARTSSTPSASPIPTGWIREIHERYNARLMISVWPKFYPAPRTSRRCRRRASSTRETLKRPTTDWLGNVHTFYDAFNPEARKLFWAADERRRSSARASTPGGWTRPSPSWSARARRERAQGRR